jgi:hypothetical protein
MLDYNRLQVRKVIYSYVNSGHVFLCHLYRKKNGVHLYFSVGRERGKPLAAREALKRDAQSTAQAGNRHISRALISSRHINVVDAFPVTIFVFVVISRKLFSSNIHLGVSAATKKDDYSVIINPFKAQWLLYVPPASKLRNSVFCPQSVLMFCVIFTMLGACSTHGNREECI